ncbi:rod shape-determining protein MreD [Verrucomicrobiota bacterium]
MTLVIMAIVLLGSTLLQAGLPAFSWLGQARFPFLLAAVLYYALNRRTNVMLTAAALAGLLQDAFSPMPLGYSACCFCLAGWAAGSFKAVVATDAPITPAFFGCVSGIAVALAQHLLLAGGGLVSYPLPRALLKCVGSGLLGMVCTPPVFYGAGWLDRITGNVEVRRRVEGVPDGFDESA